MEDALQTALKLSKQEIDRTPGVIRMPGINERSQSSGRSNYNTSSGSNSSDTHRANNINNGTLQSVSA